MHKNDAVQAVKEIAEMINPEAMAGTSPNGRFDEADTLDKAEDIFEFMQEFMSDMVRSRMNDILGDSNARIVPNATYKKLATVRKRNKRVDELLEDVDFNYASDYVNDIELDWDTFFEENKKRYKL